MRDPPSTVRYGDSKPNAPVLRLLMVVGHTRTTVAEEQRRIADSAVKRLTTCPRALAPQWEFAEAWYSNSSFTKA